MTREPRIPMLPSQLPQQRITLVKGLPLRPPGWAATIDKVQDRNTALNMPRTARYIGQVEWAWSPMHTRIDDYHLSMDRGHRRWLLWIRPYDDNWSEWGTPSVAAHGPRGGLKAVDAARLLLHDYWVAERENGTDRFHWINDDGLLDTGDLNTIGRLVWGSEGSEQDNDGGDEDEEP